MAKTVQIRDVPDDVHTALTAQAQRAGLSLDQFVLRELADIARRGANVAVFDAVEARPGPQLSTEQVLSALHEGREERT